MTRERLRAVLLLGLGLACGCSDPPLGEAPARDAGRGDGATSPGDASAARDASPMSSSADASRTTDAGPGDPSDAATNDAGDPIGEGDLDVAWQHGAANCAQDTNPPIQVHRYDPNTFILRQNKCVNYEAPFLYLLFGRDKVLLEDTGATTSATAFPIAARVQQIIAEVLAERGQASIALIVVHSHGHGDHVAGDAQFSGTPGVTVVGTGVQAVSAFFGLTSWPNGTAELDLGGRILDILPLPGHQPAHIAIYDRGAGLLLTGDSLYPGRLYVDDWAAYRLSIRRLSTFASSRTVRHVLGTHIEMTRRPGVDYPIGSTHQPEEHALPLAVRHLGLLDEALTRIGPTPRREVLDDFIIDP